MYHQVRRPHVYRRPSSGLSGQPLGGMLDDVIEIALPVYEEQIKRIQPWLRKKGQMVGKQAIAAAKGAVFDPKPEKPSGPPWLPKLVDPVINPFVEGMKGEVVPVVAGVAGATVLSLIGIGFGIGFLIGRR